MTKILIHNVNIVNEGEIFNSDILIVNGRISQIDKDIVPSSGTRVINGGGRYLLPGVIDDQVHFREPGMSHKGSIESESKAAIVGGVTSFMDMPNVNPQTTTISALEDKYKRAAEVSFANYSFYLGATNTNLNEIKMLDKNQTCGVKVFMGSSTGNMLVSKKEVLEEIFKTSPVLIATHCEDTPMIEEKERAAFEKYGENVPLAEHAQIRSAAACYKSSSFAVELAKKYNTKLHLLHLTTQDEMQLLESAPSLEQLSQKRITGEACIHHLFFNKGDYAKYGTLIKCNPSVKEIAHQKALQAALNSGKLDVIATDHAPHSWEEKQNTYFKAPSGVPLVEHLLQAALELYHNGVISLETLVQKCSHAPACIFEIKDRGFIREGYWADLVLVDLEKPFKVTKDNLHYYCNWSPFENYTFSSTIDMTMVNGEIAFENGKICDTSYAKRLEFSRK